ncbi:thiopeptide-type bacteriocin biosynthesis protein [Glaciecola sp. MH2013]|uniref:thiopeptide-type bacteriocin biosynthesis protein n=1 Tax=Glaciecola sp. MH2013 TaxID=2785524 RepID=UPI00189F33CB|nr:thiopeptide-type bacteriocin biosynthesis protein [Glaciecola sp. MH2013]MBF7073480.1 thiopeptide-type bacteriocin biosynthesis protein [Glaciecola sp. MH2013]
MNTQTPRWHAVHIFLSDPQQTESFLVDVLAPNAQKLLQEKRISQWFFIRYWQGGPHLRFRFFCSDSNLISEVIDTLSVAAQHYKAPKALTKEEYYQQHSFDGEAQDIETLAWYSDGSVVPIDYEPEYQRYGGKHALLPNETLFCQSSHLASALVKATKSNIAARTSIALSLMLTTVLAYTSDTKKLRDFFFGYATYWQQYSQQNAVLFAKEMKNEALDPKQLMAVTELIQNKSSAKEKSKAGIQQAWRNAVEGLVVDLTYIYNNGELNSPFNNDVVNHKPEPHILHILSSQIHMLNNRLSMTPSFELVLSLKLVKALNYIIKTKEEEKDNENSLIA